VTGHALDPFSHTFKQCIFEVISRQIDSIVLEVLLVWTRLPCAREGLFNWCKVSFVKMHIRIRSSFQRVPSQTEKLAGSTCLYLLCKLLLAPFYYSVRYHLAENSKRRLPDFFHVQGNLNKNFEAPISLAQN